MRKVLAVCVSDLHLSETPPVARSVEEDWLEVQAGYLLQLREIARANKAPIVCAGDVFDRWNAGPGIINVCLNTMPVMYAIPGQHDLPNHRNADMHRTAYHTLCLAGRLQNISYGSPLFLSDEIALHGFPWNQPLTRRIKDDERDECLHLAVCHRYVWRDGFGHMGAKQEDHVTSVATEAHMKSYDAAVIGDNHSGFYLTNGVVSISNCGTFMRRKMDEVNYKPCVSLYYSDNTFERLPLNCSKDKFLEVPAVLQNVLTERDYSAFLEELSSLGDVGMDFLETLKRCSFEGATSEGARKIIYRIMETIRGKNK